MDFGEKISKMSTRKAINIFSILKACFSEFNDDSGKTNCSHTHIHTHTHIDFNG